MKGFTQFETELLLKEAVNANLSGKSLSAVFEEIALKTNRAKGSVRNYYYTIIKDEDKKRQLEKNVLGVQNLKATKAQAFTKQDESTLIEQINSGRKSGKSVRRVILELSNGDQKLALRYQNKYRNYLKKCEMEKFQNTTIRPEDFKYFAKLSHEIDSLVEKIKDKYANECVKLKKENQQLLREIKVLKRRYQSNVTPFFISDKNM